MPSSGTTSTYTITADATQALRTFREVTEAALKTQRTSAAGTAGGGQKFLSGALKEQQAEARAYLADLEAIRKATARLKAGQALPANVIPGFAGGTAAQAVQFAGTQRQRNIGTNVARRAAEAGVADPGALVADLNKGFRKAFGAYSRQFVTDLTASLPKLDTRSLGSLNTVQLGQQAKQIVKLATDVTSELIATLREAKDAAARGRVDVNRRAREVAAEREREHREEQIRNESAPPRPGSLPSGSAALPPLRAASGPPGAATSNAQYDALLARQREIQDQRRNVSLLRDESSKHLRQGVFQGSNNVVVDFTKGILNLYERTRAGERQIPHDAPEFQSALTGALQTRGQAFQYVENARNTRPQDVVDIDSKTTGVIEGGVTRIFKAMQDGERETLEHLPEFDRNFKALDRILGERADAVGLAAARAQRPDQVLSATKGRTVDFTGDTPRVFKETVQGQSQLESTGKDAQSFRQAISQAYDQLTLRARKDMVDAERAIRPQDFVDLGGGFFADIGNKQRRIYNDLGDGYDSIVDGVKGFSAKSKALGKVVETVPAPFANAGDNVLRPQVDKRVRNPAEAYDQAQQVALDKNKKLADAAVRQEAQRVRSATEALQQARERANKAEIRREETRVRNAQEAYDKTRQVAGQANVAREANRVRSAQEKLEQARQQADQAEIAIQAKRVRNAQESFEKAQQSAAQTDVRIQASRVRNAQEKLEQARQRADQAEEKIQASRVRNAQEALEKAQQVADQTNVVRQASRVRSAQEKLEQARQRADQAEIAIQSRRVRNAQEALQRAQATAGRTNTEITAQRRLETLRASGQAVDVRGGRTVDVSGFVPQVFQNSGDRATLLDRQNSPDKVRKALEEGFEALAARSRKALVDAQRAIRPQDFIDLGRGVFADIGNKQRTIYRDLGDAYSVIAEGSKGFAGQSKKLNDLVSTVQAPLINAGDNVPRLLPRNAGDTSGAEREDQFRQEAARQNRSQAQVEALADERRRNLGSLREAGSGVPLQGVLQLGQYMADLRGPTLELYKDFLRLDRASAEYATVQGRLVNDLARRGTPGVGGAIISGLAQGGFGDGGGGQSGILEGLAKSGITTAKYAAISTVLFGLTSAAHSAFQEFEDFDDSVVELEVAFEKTGVASQDFLNDLADSASEAGTNVGEAMDVAASAVRAFGKATDETVDTSTEGLKAVATSFAREAGRIALLTKTSLSDAAGNLKATALGFGVPTTNFSRVTDALANAKLVGGGDEKQIGQGVANVSVAAKEAGFSLEEMGNIISDIVAKTDQGGTLVAQRLTRAFSIIGGQAGQAAIRRINAQLDPAQRIAQGPGATPAEQIKQLSAVYGGLDEAQRKLLNNQLGGTANARELIILLEDAQRLTAPEALNSAGKGAEEYEKRLKNIRAQITQIVGNLKNLVAALGNSGALAPLGLMLKTTLELVKVARTVVEQFDRIPSIIRTIGGLLIGILITSKAISAIRAANGIRGYVRGLEDTYAPQRGYARRENEDKRNLLLRTPGAQGDLARQVEAARVAREARQAARAQLVNPGQSLTQAGTSIKTGVTNLANSIKASVADYKARATYRENVTLAKGGTPQEARQARLNTPLLPTFTGGGGGTVGQRFGNTLSSGRAQLNQAGLFGGLSIAAIGVTTIAAIGESNKRIIHASNEFAKLRDLPQSFGVNDLKDTAANFRSAASNLRQSSSGVFGSTINFLEGDPTGKAAKDADDRAEAADRTSTRLTRAKRKALQGNTADLGSTIDYSSDDALSSSIDSLGKSGRDATEQMDAFQSALEGIGTKADNATRKLTEFEKVTVAARAGQLAVNNLQGAIKANPQGSFKRGEGLSVTQFGADHQFTAALSDTITAGYRAIAGDTKETKALKNVNRVELQTTTDNVVNKALNTGGFDINSAAGQKYLKDQLELAYATLIPDKEVRASVVGAAVSDVIAQTKDVRSVNDSTASFANLAAAIPALAAGKAAETVVNNSLARPATGSTNAAGARNDQVSNDLLGSQTELSQLQLGLKTLESKTDGSEENDKQLNLLRAQIAAKKVQVASAVVANMESLFQLYEASQPPENTTQAIQDSLDKIGQELKTPDLSVDDERALKTRQKQLQQQLPGAQIADKSAIQRAATDSRDLLANDQIDINQTQAELDDYTTRGVTGKALADKQKQLNDQKLKYANDQANFALAQRIADSTVGSALQDAINNLDSAQTALDQTIPGTPEYENARRARDTAKVGKADAVVADSQAQFQLGQSAKPTENTAANLQANAAELEKELKTSNLGPDAARAIQTQLNAIYQQIPAAVIADTFAALRAHTDPRDIVGNDKITEQQLEAELADFRTRGVTGKARSDKEAELKAARRKTREDRRDVTLQKKLATLDPESVQDQATAALLQAEENLRKAKKGTAEYFKAQAEVRKAQLGDAAAKLEGADLVRQLGIDLSNPVATAKNANTLAGEKLAQARKDKRSPDVINKLILEKRGTQLAEDAAVFSQFLQNAQNAESLGDISHKAYMSLLQGRLTALQAELALMDPNTNGFQQTKDQITQLRQALKSGTDELNGQFNIGDIKIPTPYEVRKALKSGSTGDILGANSSNSTAGNVTNDMSSQQVILNGVPIEQIISMIEDLFGKKVRSRATRRNP